jgi:hypothetical protein
MNSNLEWSEITIGRIEEKIHLSSPNSKSISDPIPAAASPSIQEGKPQDIIKPKSVLPLEKKNLSLNNQELMKLYNMILEGKNMDLIGLACRAFSKNPQYLPYNKSLLRIAVENKEHLSEVEWKEIWSDVLEKFPAWIAYRLAKRYLPTDWQQDFVDSLFIQNGRLSPKLKKSKEMGNPFQGRIPDWILRSPFGLAKQLLEKTQESKAMIDLLKIRLPESYLAHSLLFVDAFLERDMDRFYQHYFLAGRVKFHPQSLYMKAIMDIRSGKDEDGKEMLELIRQEDPNWEIPLFLQKRGSYATIP